MWKPILQGVLCAAGWVSRAEANTGGPWRADRGASFIHKVSLLTTEGTASLGKARKFMLDHGQVVTLHHRRNTHSLVHTLRTSLCPQTQSARPRRWILSGSFLAIRLLLGPAQVALHFHKLRGVLLLLLNLLLLQLQLQEHAHRKRQQTPQAARSVKTQVSSQNAASKSQTHRRWTVPILYLL